MDTEVTLFELYNRSWKMGMAEPLPAPIPLRHFLEVVSDEEVTLHLDDGGPLEGGNVDGWAVIRVETKDNPLFFAVPPEATPYLREHISHEDYARLSGYHC